MNNSLFQLLCDLESTHQQTVHAWPRPSPYPRSTGRLPWVSDIPLLWYDVAELVHKLCGRVRCKFDVLGSSPFPRNDTDIRPL